MDLRRSLGLKKKDEPVAATAPPPANLAADVRHAYERGRRDERARQSRRPRGFPLLTVLLVLVAGAGATVVYLGVREGSFARGGQVVDQHIDNTTGAAAAATRAAADHAGNALENAGQGIKQAAGG